MLQVPEELERITVDREGQQGKEWIAALPGLADELLRRWECHPDGPVTHGKVGVVIPVYAGWSGPAVVKISFPHPGNIHEPDAFASWAGHGAVALLARDDDNFAMLLERAGPDGLDGLSDTDEAIALAARLARRLAVPAPPGLPRLRDEAPSWAQRLRRYAKRPDIPPPRGMVEAALTTVHELGPNQPETLVHGDLHLRNVLRADREPWLVIDPKGYVGDPAYDALTLIGSSLLRLLNEPDTAALEAALHRRMAVFAEAAELDREHVRRWMHARAIMRISRGPELEGPTTFHALVRAAELLA